MSPDKPVPISADGLKKLEAELEELRNSKRHEVAERIHAAMQFGDYSENSELEQEAFTKVDASLSWTRDKLLIRAWSNNLFDREVYSYGLDLRGAGFPYNFRVPSTPRTFGISARYSF